MKTYLLTFHTHFEALQAFKAAQKMPKAENATLVAVPRKISSSCGTALSVRFSDPSELSKFVYNEAYECAGDEEFLKI